jgi:hypothetical protein
MIITAVAASGLTLTLSGKVTLDLPFFECKLLRKTSSVKIFEK